MRALIALKRPLASVPTRVIGQVPLGNEGFIATFHGTFEWLLSRMYSHVGFEVSSLCKVLSTALNGAHEGLLSSL